MTRWILLNITDIAVSLVVPFTLAVLLLASIGELEVERVLILGTILRVVLWLIADEPEPPSEREDDDEQD